MSELTIEKLKIHERLASVETKIDAVETKIDIIYKNIVGNGQIGLSTKVDRLEQSEKLRQTSIGRIWTVIVGIGSTVLGKIFLDWFKRG